MTISVVQNASGSIAAGNAHSATAIATSGVYQVYFDVSDLLTTETFKASMTTKVRNTGTEREVQRARVSGVQTSPLAFLAPVSCPYHADFTLTLERSPASANFVWRIDKIGTPTVEAEGTQTAVISTEHTLATVSTSRVLALMVDLGNMLTGDEVELRMKSKLTSGGSTLETVLGRYAGAQDIPIVQSIPMDSPYEATFTLKQIRGTGRAYDWRVDSF